MLMVGPIALGNGTMTKAKTAKNVADAKKTASKSAKETEAVKSAAGKGAKQEATKAKPAKAAPAKKTVEKAPKAIKADKPEAVAPEAVNPASAFSNAGLGIKMSTKKPALSVSPAVMILGRAAAPKQEQTPRPSDRRLSKKEQQEIKNFLLEKRERLLAGMRRELAMQRERAESKAADEVDKATDAYDEDLSFEIATANDQELEEIQVALEKIDKGTYGECEICGCGISPSRLKILPSATTCVSCRGQEEQARRRDDSPTFMMNEDSEGEVEPM